MKDQNPFKQKLFNHTVPVPDHLWSRIETQLPGTVEKKKYPFFLFVVAALLVIAGIIFIWSSQRPTNPQEDILPKENTTPAISSLDHETNNTKPVNQSNETTADSPEVTGHSNDANASVPEKFTSLSANASQNNKSEKSVRSSSSLAEMEQVGSPASKSKPSNSFAQHNSTPNSTDPSQAKKSTEAVSQAVEEPMAMEPFALQFNPGIPANVMIASLPLSSMNVIQFAETEENIIDLLKIRPDPSCYKFTGEERRSNLSFDIFAGPGFSPRKFESTTSETLVYVEARERTENFEYAWSAGGRVNYNLNENIAFRLGITFDQTGDVFDYTDTSATLQSTRIDSFFSADGTFLYEQTSTVLIFGTLIKRIHNRYSHLDIPILASYELPLGRSRLMLNGGPVINLTTKFRGQILDPGLNPRHITIGEPNQLQAYKTNLGLSIYLGAGLTIPITKTISGLIEPKFIYRINPVTQDSYQIKERRHFAGINLGIRYHFLNNTH